MLPSTKLRLNFCMTGVCGTRGGVGGACTDWGTRTSSCIWHPSAPIPSTCCQRGSGLRRHPSRSVIQWPNISLGHMQPLVYDTCRGSSLLSVTQGGGGIGRLCIATSYPRSGAQPARATIVGIPCHSTLAKLKNFNCSIYIRSRTE